MSKRSLAEELQVHPMVIGQWESGKHYPQVSYHPRIIAFLDSDDWLPRGSFADELSRVRSMNGWARSDLADRLDISERTLGRLEKGEEPSSRIKSIICNLLKLRVDSSTGH